MILEIKLGCSCTRAKTKTDQKTKDLAFTGYAITNKPDPQYHTITLKYLSVSLAVLLEPTRTNQSCVFCLFRFRPMNGSSAGFYEEGLVEFSLVKVSEVFQKDRNMQNCLYLVY